MEIVVSDITCFKHKGIRWEWTYLLDVYNNEIIASSVTNKIGNSLPYYHCLEQLIEMKKEQNCPVSPHTDQGSDYNYGVHNCIGFYSVPALELKRRLFDDSDIIEPYAIELADREDELYALIQKRNRQGIVGSFLLRRSRETKCLKAYPLLKRNLTYIRAPRTFKAADLPKNSKNGRVWNLKVLTSLILKAVIIQLNCCLRIIRKSKIVIYCKSYILFCPDSNKENCYALE